MEGDCIIENPGSQVGDEPIRVHAYVANGAEVRDMERQLDARRVESHVMVDPEADRPVLMWKHVCFLGSTAAKSCQLCPWAASN